MVGLECIEEQLAAAGIIIIILTLVAWAWASGFEKMNREHPDYKGEDLFGEEKDIDSLKDNK